MPSAEPSPQWRLILATPHGAEGISDPALASAAQMLSSQMFASTGHSNTGAGPMYLLLPVASPEPVHTAFADVSPTPAVVSQTISASAAQASHRVHSLNPLTEAEREVAQLVVRRYSSKEIAVKRGTSIATARNQRAKVYEKLGVSSVDALARRLGQTLGASRDLLG